MEAQAPLHHLSHNRLPVLHFQGASHSDLHSGSLSGSVLKSLFTESTASTPIKAIGGAGKAPGAWVAAASRSVSELAGEHTHLDRILKEIKKAELDGSTTNKRS